MYLCMIHIVSTATARCLTFPNGKEAQGTRSLGISHSHGHMSKLEFKARQVRPSLFIQALYYSIVSF